MQEHTCCYYNCPEPGTINLGPNGGDSHWICFHHLERWNQNRARFLADGCGCEMQELGELLTAAPSARAVPWGAGVGCLPLRLHMNNNNPEVLAVVPLPSAAERRLREINLARLMLVMVDIVLAGDPLGLESARDLVREIKHTFPELQVEGNQN
jgi:hypothetical protein